MGDVFRLVFFLDSFFQQFTFRTVTENHGQILAWMDPRPAVTERMVEAVGRLTYSDVIEQRHVYAVAPFHEVKSLIAAHVAR